MTSGIYENQKEYDEQRTYIINNLGIEDLHAKTRKLHPGHLWCLR